MHLALNQPHEAVASILLPLLPSLALFLIVSPCYIYKYSSSPFDSFPETYSLIFSLIPYPLRRRASIICLCLKENTATYETLRDGFVIA